MKGHFEVHDYFWMFYFNLLMLPFCFRGQPPPSKETSYSAVNTWSRSSPNCTAPGARLQTASSSTSTSLTSKRAEFNPVAPVEGCDDVCWRADVSSAWQVPGAVQARQSVREIHPGIPQERQQRVLQAQEQPPAGGVGANDGIVRLHRQV